MKIALYVGSWPPKSDATGITTYVANIAPALREAGHEVFLLTHGSSDEYTIDVDRFATRPSLWHKIVRRFFPMFASVQARSTAIANAIRHLVEYKGVEVLEIEESFGLSRDVSRQRTLPILVRLHGPWFLNANGANTTEDKIRQYWEGDAIEEASFVTAPSKHVLELTIGHYKLNQYETNVRGALVPNPIAPRRETWSIERCAKKQFLFVGRFDAIKGGDLVLNAFAKVAREDEQATLTFVGPDRGIDGKGFYEFVRAEQPDLADRIRYLGLLSRQEIDRLRLDSFAVIFASRFENFAYTVLEALALGCPIIAAAAGGIPEMIEDRKQGLLFQPGSFDQLASRMMEMIENPELACALAKGARNKASHYAPETIAAQTLACYETAVVRFERKF